MNYEEMSNKEVNRAIVELIHKPEAPYCELFDGVWCYSVGHFNSLPPVNAFMVPGDNMTWVPYPDYCNNPSDAWPIIVENGIGVQFFGDTWMSFIHNVASRHFTYDKNPLRAACICFLKMKDAEK